MISSGCDTLCKRKKAHRDQINEKKSRQAVINKKRVAPYSKDSIKLT